MSSCLLGESVRHDGGHKRDRFLVERLGPFVEWVPVCPELESGLGVPRPAMRLVRDGEAVRLLEIQSGRDHTRRMKRFAARRVRELRKLELCGYVLKSGSPSCGMTRVVVCDPKGAGRRHGRGLFAGPLLDAFPGLPVEEEGRLHDPELRENWIERIFAYRRLRELFGGRWTARQLLSFHAAHRLQLLAHAPQAYRALDRLVDEQKGVGRAALRERYQTGFMAALARRATRSRHARVLQHSAGQLKKRLDAASRQELARLVDDYRTGLVPLVVPITLLRHHVRRHDVRSLEDQHYLDPHPRELMLRNRV